VTGTLLWWGGLGGAGVWLIGWGLWPPRASLAAGLEILARPAPARLTGTARLRALLAAPLARLGLPGTQTRRDLALLRRDPALHLATQAVAAAVGMLAVPLLAVAAGAFGAVPALLSLAGAAAGLGWVELRVRSQAGQARRELVHTLSAVLDLVTVSLAGGAGVEQALRDATTTARGWAAQRLRDALTAARLARQPPWTTLGQLGTEVGVDELEKLAAALSLAGSEGARVRTSLAARAQALRTRQTIAMVTAANAATERMALPLIMLGFAFMIFILYPTLVTIGTTL
jgi:Flp pilus assembly protein TadB